MKRSCSGCTLCCRLLPVVELEKAAGARCQHQRTGKGCGIYDHAPSACRLWNCRWLLNDDTAELRRPDRSGYVIDIMPDYVTQTFTDGRPPHFVEVVQVWVDPKRREAWHDPALLAYLERRAVEGKAAIIRFSNREGLVVFAPSISFDNQWHVVQSELIEREHSAAEKVLVLAHTRAQLAETTEKETAG